MFHSGFILFQMWPMQTKQQGNIGDTRSSSPHRRYFPSLSSAALISFRFEVLYIDLLTPPCVVQFYACEAVLEEQGIFGGECPVSLYV